MKKCKHPCSLNNGNIVPGKGPKDADIMIIGEAPGYNEDQQSEPFVDRSGQLLSQLLKDVGIDRDRVYITNVCKCRPEDNRTPNKEEIKACLPILLKEIERIHPTFIVLLGNTALQAILGRSGITKYRGTIIEWKDGIKVLPTFHPAACLRNPKNLPQLKADLMQLVLDTQPKKEDRPWVFIRNKSGIKALLEDATQAKAIAYDIETKDELVLCVGFAMKMPDKTERGYFLPLGHPESPFVNKWEKVMKLTIPILERTGDFKAATGAQNGKFDNRHYRRVFPDCQPNLTFDTMMASHVLDENSPHGLDYLSQVYCHAPNYKSEVDRANLHLEKLDKVAWYNMQDNFYTLDLMYILKKLLKRDPRLWSLFTHYVMPGVRALETAEQRGMYINQDELQRQTEIVVQKIYDCRKELQKFVDKPLCGCATCAHCNVEMWCDVQEETVQSNEWFCDDYKMTRKKAAGFNLNSSLQLATLLFQTFGLEPVEYTKAGKPSTAEQSLMYLDHPFISWLLEYRKYNVLYNTFLKSWREKSKTDGRIHTSFKAHGTVTGRLSSEKPNMQNVPRESSVRNVIGAPPGWKFIEADYSQIELRVAAHMAGERAMTQIYANNGDIHSATAAEILHKTVAELTKEERKRAKAVNFGFLYGMSGKKFQKYAKEKYGVELTLQESYDTRKRYFKKYRDLIPWHEKQRRIAEKLGYVRSPLGRKRRLPDVNSVEEGIRAEALRQAVNSPVQAVPPDLTMAAMGIISEMDGYGQNGDEIWIVCQVHDAILFECREEYVEKWAPIIKHIMEHIPTKKWSGVEFTVPIQVEVKASDVWGGPGKVYE